MPKPGIKSLLKHVTEYVTENDIDTEMTVAELIDQLRDDFVAQELG
jgi:hypothetical protein